MQALKSKRSASMIVWHYRTWGWQDERRLQAFFRFLGWSYLGLGVRLWAAEPCAELHVPFGFFRLGWRPSDVDIVIG